MKFNNLPLHQRPPIHRETRFRTITHYNRSILQVGGLAIAQQMESGMLELSRQLRAEDQLNRELRAFFKAKAERDSLASGQPVTLFYIED